MFQVRIYSHHPDNYDVVFNIKKYGQKGVIDSLKSDAGNFYKNFDMIFDHVALECGVIEIFALVTPSHSRAIKRLLGKKYDITILGKEAHAGRAMVWIRCAPFT